MKITFTKRQLRLVEDDNLNNSKPALAITNSEHDNDASSLKTDIEKTMSHNPNGNPMEIDAASYSSNNISKNDANTTVNISKGSDVASQAYNMIKTGKVGKVRITNGVERSGNLVEVTTFNKKELDAFLESL